MTGETSENSDSGDHGGSSDSHNRGRSPVMTLSLGSAFPIRLLLLNPKTTWPQHIQRRQFQHCILRSSVVMGVRMGWGWVEVLAKSQS